MKNYYIFNFKLNFNKNNSFVDYSLNKMHIAITNKNKKMEKFIDLSHYFENDMPGFRLKDKTGKHIYY